MELRDAENLCSPLSVCDLAGLGFVHYNWSSYVLRDPGHDDSGLISLICPATKVVAEYLSRDVLNLTSVLFIGARIITAI